jgi:hypothetical protein
MTGEQRRRRRHREARPRRLTVRFSAAEWDAVWTLAQRDRLAVAAWVAVAASEKASDKRADGVGQADLRAVLGELNLARTQLAKAGALLNHAAAAPTPAATSRTPNSRRPRHSWRGASPRSTSKSTR